MPWVFAGGAIIALAILTGQGGALAAALKGATGGGASIFGSLATVNNPVGVGAAAYAGQGTASVTPSYTNAAPVAAPSYAAPAAPTFNYAPAPTPTPTPAPLPATTQYAPSGLPIGAGAGSGYAYVPIGFASGVGLTGPAGGPVTTPTPGVTGPLPPPTNPTVGFTG